MSGALCQAEMHQHVRDSLPVCTCAWAVVTTPFTASDESIKNDTKKERKKKKENGAATSTVVAWVIWSIPCNYWDLCSSTFQGEFVSKPPVEIWSVFNSFNARRGGWEWAGGRWAVSSQFSLHLTTQHSHFALCQPECISKITYHYCLIDRVEPSSACIRFDWYLKPVI